jgi:hypothetical protein
MHKGRQVPVRVPVRLQVRLQAQVPVRKSYGLRLLSLRLGCRPLAVCGKPSSKDQSASAVALPPDA